MRHRSASIVVVLLLVCSASQAMAGGHFWRPYTEWEVRGDDPYWAGQGNLFLPLHQSQVNILFADLRGNWTDTEAAHGNLGLAFRQMLIHDWIFGIHGAYDTSHSRFGNNFHQATLGFELLDPNWGLRWNGYLAGEGPKLIPALNRVNLVGNNLLIRRFSERAYSGQDFELERRLWYRDSPSDGSWRHWVHAQNVELWGAIGVFNFDNDAAGFNDMTGPRARMEVRLFDIPYAGPDSRLVFGGQYEYDDVRGSIGTGMLNVRIPFGRGTSQPRKLLRGLNRRMVAPIERNTDIISAVGLESVEGAAFARTGQVISQVVSIDATTPTPAAAIAAAGNDSLVIVDGGVGDILPGGTINVQSGQVVMGGGGNLAVRGLNSGTLAVFNAPGSRPLVDSIGNTTFLTANDSTLLTMDIRNSGDNLSGILLNGNTGVLIEDVDISVTGPASVGLQSAGASQFVVNDSMIRTSGQFGNGLQLTGTSQATVSNSSIGTSNLDAKGIFVAQDSFLNLIGSSVFTGGSSGAEGILAIGNTQLVVNNTVVTVTGPNTAGILASPIAAADVLTMQVVNSNINSTGDGVALSDGGFGVGTLNATISGNTISSAIGSNEINAETNGVAVLNLSAQGNNLEPTTGTIRLSEIGGSINVTQSAPGTNSTGIDAANGLPATNVLIPGNAVDFNQPPPPLPTP